MSVIAQESYLDFRGAIPAEFITTTGPHKGRRVKDFREIVGTELLRFRAKHMTTTGNAVHRDSRWSSWFSDVSYDEITCKKMSIIKDDTISGLKDKQSDIEYYIAAYYRFHAVLYDKSFSDTIDNLVFKGPLRKGGRAVFILDTRPTAPFIHPPYVTEEYVRKRLEEDQTDGIWLNPHNHYSIKLSGRQEEKEHLDSFMGRQEKFLICPVVAPSGAGKTRLISEWMKPYVPSVSATEWDAGFVISREVVPWTKQEWKITRNTLIVIDYTFAYADVVKEITRRAREDGSERKIRLIIIDHVLPKKLSADSFWQGLYISPSIEHGHKFVNERFDALRLQPEASQAALLQDIVAAVARAAGKEFSRDHPKVKAAVSTLYGMGAPGNADAVRHPLFAALVGHALGQGRDTSRWDRRGVIDYYFSANHRLPWKTWTESSDAQRQGLAVGALVSAATLRRGLCLSQLKRRLPGDSNKVVQFANRIVASEPSEKLKPFEPDILGETFVLKFLEEVDNRQSRGENEKQWAWKIFISMLDSSENEEEQQAAFNFQETMHRLVSNLINDDQDTMFVKSAWNNLQNFLNPHSFRKSGLLRAVVSVAIIDVFSLIYNNLDRETAVPFLSNVSYQEIIEECVKNFSSKFFIAITKLYEWYSEDNPCADAIRINMEKIVKSNKNYNIHSFEMIRITAIENAAKSFSLVRRFVGPNFKIDRKEGGYLLREVCKAGKPEIVRGLLEMGASSHRLGWEDPDLPIFNACIHGNIESAILLYEFGANLHPKDYVYYYKYTPLMEACANRHKNIFYWLLEKGVPLNQICPINGTNTLMAACEGGDLEIVQTLLDRGLEPNYVSRGNVTALMVASIRGHCDICKALLSYGADPSLKSENGMSAAAGARLGGYEEVATLLESYEG